MCRFIDLLVKELCEVELRRNGLDGLRSSLIFGGYTSHGFKLKFVDDLFMYNCFIGIMCKILYRNGPVLWFPCYV